VRTLVPVVGFGLNDTVTPLGRLEAARLTLPLNPFAPATVMLDVPAVPWTVVREAGAELRVKLGNGWIPVPLSVMLCVV